MLKLYMWKSGVSTTNTTTALSTASPIAALIPLALDFDVLGSNANVHVAIPDGVEVPANDYVGISVHNAITSIATTLTGVCLIGYTY